MTGVLARVRQQGWTHLRAAAAMGIALLANACSCAVTQDEIELRVQDGRYRTIPPGARELSFSGVQRNATSVQARWEFEVDQSWGHYQLWVKTRLHREFQTASKAEPGAVFRMQLPGDTYNLDVDLLSEGPPLRIRVTFVARPS